MVKDSETGLQPKKINHKGNCHVFNEKENLKGFVTLGCHHEVIQQVGLATSF